MADGASDLPAFFPFGQLRGGADAWDEGVAGVLLTEDYFEAAAPSISASVTATEAVDSLTASAKIAISGAVIATETADTLTSAVTLASGIAASVTATERADTLAASAHLTANENGVYLGRSQRQARRRKRRVMALLLAA